MQYQPIEFPDGTKVREEDLDKDSFGKKEWSDRTNNQKRRIYNRWIP